MLLTCSAPPRRWRGRALTLVTCLLTASWGSYAVVGDELFSRAGAALNRAVRRAGEAVEDYRSRAEAGRLSQARKAFEEMLACREGLARQVQALGERRASAAARLDQEKALLRRVLDAREAKEGPVGEAPDDLTEVEWDAADARRRVQAHEEGLAKYDAEIRRLEGSLERLDRDVDRARLALQRQSDELDRRNAGTTGGRAYRNARDLADQIVTPGR